MTPHGMRLLILDDDAEVVKFISHVAETFGFETRAATLPSEMFSILAEWKPTHLAIDLIMPDMDGVEVLRELADKSVQAAIIVTSGMGIKVLEAARQSGIRRGLNIVGVLPKPFSVQALRELLDGGKKGTLQAPTIRPAAHIVSCSKPDFLEALEAGQFVLYYQPKIDLALGNIVGFEALVRWDHPVYGLIFPDTFIRAAEECGVMTPLTYRCFDIGLQWLASIEHGSPLTISMNISAVNFIDLDLVDRLHWSCLRSKIDPSRVTLELTETSAVDNTAAAFDVMSRLRIKGFTIGIDDFGTGYSTMMQLMRLPFSEIKIDRTFVGTMHENQESMTIVDSTIELGQRLGLTTVAEGVETAMQMRTLRKLRCDVAQGYYIARPMIEHQAKRFLAEWSPRQMGPMIWTEHG